MTERAFNPLQWEQAPVLVNGSKFRGRTIPKPSGTHAFDFLLRPLCDSSSSLPDSSLSSAVRVTRVKDDADVGRVATGLENAVGLDMEEVEADSVI